MRDQPGFFSRLGPQVLKHRWLVMASIGLIAIGLEINERIQLHDLVLDFSFFFEAFLEGVVLPVLGGFLLSVVERATKDRDLVTNQLAVKKALTQAINNTQNWNDLLKVIVEYPRGVLPLAGSVLLVNDLAANQFKPEAFWGLYGLNPETYTSCHPGKICETCALNRLSDPLQRCGCEENLPDREEVSRLCMPLVHGNLVVGLLHLYLSPKVVLNDRESKILENLAPEMAVAIDNSRSKRLNMLLKENNDAELRRIARDLHDNLAQSLVYLRHKLSQLTGEDTLGEITNLRKDLERMRQVVDDAYLDVRSTLKELEASVSTDLIRMLEDYGQLTKSRYQLDLHFRNNGLARPISTGLARQILAIFTEILTNVEKHSEAQKVFVDLSWEEDSLTLSVLDDGRGFEMNRAHGHHGNGHMGLALLRERADELNGTITIRSTIGSGTEVTLWLPLTVNAKEAHLV
jgi:signal transduction histidine kinase